MRHFVMIAACAVPLALAACSDAGIKSEQTVVGDDEVAAVLPADGSKGSETVIVRPTRLVSTNLAALAGSYDTDELACRHATSPSRISIADDGMTLEGQKCDLAALDRDGSALKVDLVCRSGNTRTERVAYVTPAAQGVLLRADSGGDRELVRCER